MKKDGRFQYHYPFDNSLSDEENFPNGLKKYIQVTTPQGLRISHTHYLIKLNGSENLEVMAGKFVDNLIRYADAAALNGPQRFDLTMELLSGTAATYYRLLIDDPNGAYIQPHNINRTPAQHLNSLRDLWTKLMDETWLGDACYQQYQAWPLSKYKSVKGQKVCDLFVHQEGRKNELLGYFMQRMHFRGNPIGEPEKIAHLKNKCPEDLWDKANAIEDLDQLNTSIAVAEVIDRVYKPEFEKAQKDSKKNDNGNGNGKRKTDDSSSDGNPTKKGRNGNRNNRNGRNGRNNNNRNGNDRRNNQDRRPQHNASKEKPSNGQQTVVLENGWTGLWKNCPVNPGSHKFDWTSAKKYNFDEGGKDTWYLDIFIKEARRRKASQPQSNYQSPQPYPPQPQYPQAQHAYHYGVPPTSSHPQYQPQQQGQAYHFQGAPYSAPQSYGAPPPPPPSFGQPPARHF